MSSRGPPSICNLEPMRLDMSPKETIQLHSTIGMMSTTPHTGLYIHKSI